MAEPHADVAVQILESGMDLAAPAHWLAEAVSAVWAATRRGDLTGQQSEGRARVLAEAPVATVPLDELIVAAMTIGLRVGVTIYDALYLALAEEQDSVLVTDDRRLLLASRGDRQLRNRVIWIGDRSARHLLRGQP